MSTAKRLKKRRAVRVWPLFFLGMLLWIVPQLRAGEERLFHPGEGKVQFAAYPPMADRPVDIYYYIPCSAPVETMPVLFVMHGADRKAAALLPYWKELADEKQFMVFVPELSAEAYPLRDYQEVGLRRRDSTWNEPALRTPVLLDRIFEYIRYHSGIQAGGYKLYGHSAGGQFVQRFMLFHDSPYVEKAVVSSPGWYTFPDTTLAYPYGVKDVPGMTKERLGAYLEKPVILQLGIGDTIREWYLRKTPEAEAQGANRYERGKTFYASLQRLAQQNGWPFRWGEWETAGIGHHSGLMGQAAAPLLFGDTTRVLFIGNSYTHVNRLPELVRRLAESQGKNLVYEMIAPGGCTLARHLQSEEVKAALHTRGWDFVVLQEQSRAPSLASEQVCREVYPAARALDSLRRLSNPQAKTVFYMTWGRRDGDTERCASDPEICTYAGMQARLRKSYLEMAVANGAWCAPVGVAWKRVREERPDIELYQPDKSHPSLAGSYLGASVFYTLLYGEPLVSAYTAGLDPEVARYLQRTAAETVLSNPALWNVQPVSQPVAVTERFYPEPAGSWDTPTLGKEAGEGLASCREIGRFLEKLAARHPGRARLASLGKTPGGRDIPVLYVGDGAAPEKKLKVWIQGGLHGNEPAGVETVCRLAEAVLEGWPEEAGKMAKELAIAFVPVANPDGYAVQQRVSGSGYDLNRDQTKLADTMTVLLKRGYVAWQPEVALDIHEFRPLRKEFTQLRQRPAATYADALFLPTGHPNVPLVLRELTSDLFQPAAEKALAAAGYTSCFYFTPTVKEGRLYLVKGAKSPQSSSTSFGLSNAVSMFVEIRGIGLGPVSFGRRTDVGFRVGYSLLQTALRHKQEVKKGVQEAVRQTVSRKAPAVVTFEPQEKVYSVQFIDLNRSEAFTAELPALDGLRNTFGLTRYRPKAYFLADTCVREVKNLRTLGIEVERLEQLETVEVERYVVSDYAQSNQVWEGIYPVRVRTSLEKVTRTFPVGSYRVDPAQRGGNLAVTLLEPESENGFVAFGVTPADLQAELPVYRWGD